ncbi:low temperature requirement protein A [Streptomyces sp. NPDC085612]|uniref:low temperature requirement protein A n=1 Tax=Streptomyces sp. NPDC085612 TaxID=3365732 RepID=UPI0037CD1333
MELFYDLVFVFSVSQLSHHLLEHLDWRGAAETAVLLVASVSRRRVPSMTTYVPASPHHATGRTPAGAHTATAAA